MELRHLRYFVAVAEELSFTRAAEKLRVSQPPLSRQIKELEVYVGARLLNRSNRLVQLTPAGQLFYEQAKQILEQTGQLADRARRVEEGELGHLSIGFVPSLGLSLLPRVVRRFREAFPGVSLTLLEKSEIEQSVELERGAIDIGLARPDPMNVSTACEVLVSEPLLIAIPDGHRYASEEPFSLLKFRDEPFIDFPRNRAPFLVDAALRMCISAGFIPIKSQTANSLYTCLGLVGAGVGWSILPASAMEVKIDHVLFRLPIHSVQVETSMLWCRDKETTLLKHFMDICREIAKDYVREQRTAMLSLM